MEIADNRFFVKQYDGYVGIEFKGRVTPADIEAAYRALTDEDAFVSARRLWDLRACRLELTLRDLDELAHISKQKDAGQSRVAILVDAGVATTLVGIFSGFRSSAQVQVSIFEKPVDAVGWLKSPG